MKATRLWEYTDANDPAGCRPIGSLDEPVRTDLFYRIFDSDKVDLQGPQIVVYGGQSIERNFTIRLEFTGERPREEMRVFWHQCRLPGFLKILAGRWGEVKVQWNGPGYQKSDCATELVAFFDESGGSAWLDHNFPLQPAATFRDLFADFDFLRELFHSQLAEGLKPPPEG
jgi:hypothetical protein